MHVTLTRVSTGEEPNSVATMVGEEMDRWLRDLEGYEGFLMLSCDGTTYGMTFWESTEAAERYGALRSEFRERMVGLTGAEIEEVVDLDMTYARLPQLG